MNDYDYEYYNLNNNNESLIDDKKTKKIKRCPAKAPKNCTDPIWHDHWTNPTNDEKESPCIERNLSCERVRDEKNAELFRYPCEDEGQGDDCEYPSWDDPQEKINRLLDTMDTLNLLQTNNNRNVYDINSLSTTLERQYNTKGGKKSMKKINKRRRSKKL
jgi:hypothetical protein